MYAGSNLQRGSPDRFGYSWSIFKEILPEHREQFLRWSAALPRSSWQDVFFLDAGCGMGRNSYWAMVEGAAGGIAIDVDDRSLAAARENLRIYPTVEVRHHSIYQPIGKNLVDVAFSIGVIHHLESPDIALAAMVHAVKYGGQVLIWVYGAENMGWLVRFFDPLRKAIFSRMPLRVVYFISGPLTAILWLFLRLWPIRIEYLHMLKRFRFTHLRAIVFDHLIPRIANYWSRSQVEEMIAGAGLKEIQLVWVNEMSWSATGRKL